MEKKIISVTQTLDIQTWRAAEEYLETMQERIKVDHSKEWIMYQTKDELDSIMEKNTGIQGDFRLVVRADNAKVAAFLLTEIHAINDLLWNSTWEDDLPMDYEFPSKIIRINKDRARNVFDLEKIHRPYPLRLLDDGRDWNFPYKNTAVFAYKCKWVQNYMYLLRPMEPQFALYQNWKQIHQNQLEIYDEVLKDES